MDSSDGAILITLDLINGAEPVLPGTVTIVCHNFKRKSIRYLNLSLQATSIPSATLYFYSCEDWSEIK